MTSDAGSSDVPRVVAVTGAAGYIGERLVERLLAHDGVQRVIGIDVRPSALEHDKLTFVQRDITRPLEEVFRRARVESVVHLAFILRQLRDRAEAKRVNVEGASNVLWACEAAGVKRIVLMSSSTVYGPHEDNPEALTEEDAVRPTKGFSYAEDKATTEMYYRRYQEQRADATVSILRGCVVLGPNAQNFITSALDKPVLIGVGGADPPMQFLHEEDLIEILWRFVTERHAGIYNVAAPGTVHWSELVRMAGKRMLRFSAPIAYGLANLTWRLKLQNDAPGVGLDFIRWPWVVSTDKLAQELGYEFKHTSRQTVEAFLGIDPLARPAIPSADE